jgi:hypothetical protein
MNSRENSLRMTSMTPRQRFLSWVRGEPGARPVVSPFLPCADVINATMSYLSLPAASDDIIRNEVEVARALDYEPMFMTDCSGLIFPWRDDPERSDDEWIVSTIATRRGPWVRTLSRALGQWGDESGFPVKTEKDHEMLAQVCEEIGDHEDRIRAYFRDFRARVGEDGVIVIGHPHVSWLGYQASQQNLIFHRQDYPEAFARSMRAIMEASLFVFVIAMEEGVDFMSESCSGLEMTSPREFDEVDLPVLVKLSEWTHERGGLFWYHNCGQTRELIRSGRFNRFAPDVLETIAPPPEGDNDLAQSRRAVDPRICTKGNLSLGTLRNGTVADVVRETRALVDAVRGFRHIYSTADGVLSGTPPANFVAFVRTATQAAR